MEFFDGKKHAEILEKGIREYLENNPSKGELAIVKIGDDKSSEKYVQLKRRLCEKLGIVSHIYNLGAGLSDSVLCQEVTDIFSDTKVRGGIVQLPFPRESLKPILNLIPKNKDIDVLSEDSLKDFYNGEFKKLSPVVRTFKYFLDVNNLDLKDMDVVVIGEGFLVGKPISFYAKSMGARVQVLKKYKKRGKIEAGLVVLSVGSPNLVSGEDIQEGCSIIDFGSSVQNNVTVGDLNLNSKLDHLNIISPSPGGVGPLVVRYLIMNLLRI